MQMWTKIVLFIKIDLKEVAYRLSYTHLTCVAGRFGLFTSQW